MQLTQQNLDRFNNKINKTPTCWEWTGAKNNKGYGCLAVNKQKWLAHRLSYTITKGQIPAGQIICHTCDNPHCVNPQHLFAGTHTDNIKDMLTKNRQGTNLRPKTHCRKGHPFTHENTYHRKNTDGTTHQNCKTCRNTNRKNNRNNPEKRPTILEKERNYQKTHYRKKRSPQN